MAKRERHTRIGEQFAPRQIEMLESPAYRALSLSGHRALARIEIELAHHGRTDNGRLAVTYDNFQQYGIDRHGIGRALRELAVLGFIEITDPGRAGNREFRRPARYRLTYRHTKAASATHEWKSITTKEQADRQARRARAERKRPRAGDVPGDLRPVTPEIVIADADLVTS